MRGRKAGQILYGFGDASKAAFGATIQLEGQVTFRCGQWSAEIVERNTSNWKELANLVDCLVSTVTEKLERLRDFYVH